MAGLCACYFSAAREIEFFTRNRRGHDRRYGLDSEMISSTVSFDKAVKKTVRWYIESRAGYPVLLQWSIGNVYFSQESNTYNSLRSVAYGIGIETPHRQWAGSLKNNSSTV